MYQASLPVPYWDVQPRGIGELLHGEAKTVPVDIVGEPGGEVVFSTTNAEVARVENATLTFGAKAGAAMIIAEAIRDGAIISRRYMQVEVGQPVGSGSGISHDWQPTGYVEQLTDGTWHFYFFSGWYDENGNNIAVSGDLNTTVFLDGRYLLVFDIWGEIESVATVNFDRLELYIEGRCIKRFNPEEGVNGLPLQPYLIPRRTERIDLSAFANRTVNIQFHWDTGDALYQKFDGWFVKDIRLVPIGG